MTAHSIDPLANALKALADCIEAMEMQAGRQEGLLHIPANVAGKIWTEALEQAHYTLISKGTMR